MINYGIEHDLSLSKECITSKISITPAVPGTSDPYPPVLDVVAIHTTGASFQLNYIFQVLICILMMILIFRRYTARISKKNLLKQT